MAVTIRLARTGRKKIATYRIVATDSRFPRDGRFLETLGAYYPQRDPKEFSINVSRMKYWIDQGATPSETVANLLKQDNFSQKAEALSKGIAPETAEIPRLPERKRKPKAAKQKKSAA